LDEVKDLLLFEINKSFYRLKKEFIEMVVLSISLLSRNGKGKEIFILIYSLNLNFGYFT